MTAKKWINIAIIIIFIIFFFNTTYLYVIDTYKIVTPDSNEYKVIPNQRVPITEYILKNKDIYDSLIFGSSRVGYINPFHINNQSVYNMTYAAGIPHEHLLIIKLLLDRGMKLKHLLIGLDDISYQGNFEEYQTKLGSKSHYLVTSETKLEFYKDFFFHKPSKDDYKSFSKKDLPLELREHIYNSIYNQQKLYTEAKHINTRTAKYINDPKFNYPIIVYDSNQVNESLADIKEIVNISKIYNIDTKFIIVPMHKKTYEFSNKERFYEFRKKLSEITSYYDFGLPNEVNNNNIYWKETSHFTTEVGDMILNRIYDNNTSIKNFGVFVNKI